MSEWSPDTLNGRIVGVLILSEPDRGIPRSRREVANPFVNFIATEIVAIEVLFLPIDCRKCYFKNYYEILRLKNILTIFSDHDGRSVPAGFEVNDRSRIIFGEIDEITFYEISVIG